MPPDHLQESLKMLYNTLAAHDGYGACHGEHNGACHGEHNLQDGGCVHKEIQCPLLHSSVAVCTRSPIAHRPKAAKQCTKGVPLSTAPGCRSELAHWREPCPRVCGHAQLAEVQSTKVRQLEQPAHRMLCLYLPPHRLFSCSL